MRRRSSDTTPDDGSSNIRVKKAAGGIEQAISNSIEKPSRLETVSSDDNDNSTMESNNSRKNKTLLDATDEEEHISPETCDSYEYARDMSRIMPDISLSEMKINPFVKYPELNSRQKLKLLFGCITLLPIRLLLISLLLLLLTPYGWLIYHTINILTFTLRLNNGSVVNLKYWLRWPLFWMIRAILFVMGFYTVETVIKTAKVDKSAQFLVAAPHRSVWDAVPYLVCSQLYGNVTVASRYENSRIPILGSLLMLFDPILVKRDCPRSRAESRQLIQDRSKYQKVLIYPEGTCTNGKHLVEFKTGAFIPGQTVQPIAIEYKLFDRHIDNVTWTWMGGYRAWKLVVMTLCLWRTDLKLTILPSHKPKRSERQDCRKFARRVAQKLSRELALPISRYSFDDAKLMELATELRLPRSLVCLRFLRLAYGLHIEMCIRLRQDMPQEGLLQQEAYVLSEDQDPFEEDDFTSFACCTFKTPTVADAIRLTMRHYLIKLSTINETDMTSELNTREDFVRMLNIDKKYANKIVDTSVIDYFLKALKCDNVYPVNALTILLVMVLCDVREPIIAKRILTCMTLMNYLNRQIQLQAKSVDNSGSTAISTTSTTIATNNGSHQDQSSLVHNNEQHQLLSPMNIISGTLRSGSKHHHANIIEVNQKGFQQQQQQQQINSTATKRAEDRHLANHRTPLVVTPNEQEAAALNGSLASNLEQPQQLLLSPFDLALAKRANSPTVSPSFSQSSSPSSSSSDSIMSTYDTGEHSICITFEQFQLLIWLLLGIENLDKNGFPNNSFSYDYVMDNLNNWFTRAVSENLPYANNLTAQRAKIDVNKVLKTHRKLVEKNSERTKNKFLNLVQGFEYKTLSTRSKS